MEDNKVWVVAYIDGKQLPNVDRELGKYPEYAEVEYYIPLVKVLKKQFKGDEIFDHIPLLFNYGFFKIPRNKAVKLSFLNKFKDNIGCVFSWVNDYAKKIPPNVPRGKLYYEDIYIPIATVTSEQLEFVKEYEKDVCIYDKDDVDSLKKDQFIVLHGYPFDGLKAQVLDIDLRKQVIRVQLEGGSLMKNVEVKFDNVFYTPYKHPEEKLEGNESIDVKIGNKTFDRMQKGTGNEN